MRNEPTLLDRQRPAGRTCANEGCGRPAEEWLCGPCALEWSLFHREDRPGPRPSVDRQRPAR